MPAISPFGRQRQKDLQFKTSLDYIVRRPLFQNTHKKISDKTHDSVYSLLGKRFFHNSAI